MTKFIMLVGLPASGKTTVAKELSEKFNAVIHSSDKLREEMFDDVNDVSRNNELFAELHKRIKQDLQTKNVIYDATNISYKRRKAFIENLDCEKICYLIATPYEICQERNLLREKKVPPFVIERMYKNIYIPQYYEGWDKIDIIWTSDKLDTHTLFNGPNGLNKIEQDNPNHTLTIGKHCLKCTTLCEEVDSDPILNTAALYHDIGKRFVKQFKNSKGENTEEAHYYQHHLVSAYDSLFYIVDHDMDTILKITNYIQWHMQPFFIKTDKSKQKFINLVGQECYDKIMILHQADKDAR